MNISQLCDRYISEYLPGKKPRSQAEDARQIAKYILPAIGELDIHQITHKAIADLHASLAETPYQANRVLSLVSKLFAFADIHGLRAGPNPARGIRGFNELKRVRYMTEEEAPRLAAALAEHEAKRPLEVAYIRLLMLSGARPEEIGRARWDWLKDDASGGGTLSLPDSKTGARIVYLSPALMRLLKSLPRTDARILAGAKPHALWTKIRYEAKLKDLRLYDLRHTFASAALASGFTLDQIGELLGHRSAQTTKRYAHLLPSKGHEAAALTSARIEGMMQR